MPWVERIRYSEDFASEEEAKKWLEEQERMFEEIERQFMEIHRKIWSWLDSFFERTPPYRRETAEPPKNLIERIERMEREIKEIKELLTNKYIKKKEKAKYAIY